MTTHTEACDASPEGPDQGRSNASVSLPTSLGNRVLVLAPSGNDALLTANFLRNAGIDAHICGDMPHLVRCINEGCGALVLAEETLNPATATLLFTALAGQPSWSDIPVGVVTSRGEPESSRQQQLEAFGRENNITLIERPFRPATLIRTVMVALRTRQRQYQVRDLWTVLKGNEARIRRLLEQTAVGLAELDLQGWFTMVNDHFCSIARRSRAELLQLRLRDITHPDDVEPSASRRESLFIGKLSSSVIENRYVRPDGSEVWVQDHLSTIRDLNGELCGIAVASADITDRKQAEETAGRARDEALAASRAKDEFLAALSHELRTPLNPVLLLASEGATNSDYPAAARGDFATISRNVSLEARLFDDLLDLTRITRGKLSIEQRPHELHGSLRDALATVDDELQQRQITVKLDLASSSPLVSGDSVRLQQVFWNVLKNAAKFTPMRGTITVTTATRGDQAVVTIQDTGIGLTANELPRIFETFAQGDHAATHGAHRFGGLGLGLAISKTIVELHGGKITASSGGRDQGATFVIGLPLLQAVDLELSPLQIRPGDTSPPVETSPLPVAETGSRPRLLIVEDHEPTRLALSRLLVRRKYEVFIAGSVAEALTIASRIDISLVLSDIGLPDGSGYDVMRELRAVHHIRGIALTGYGQDKDIAMSREAGFMAHLTKPIDVRSLDRALAELNAAPTG
ncbi:MAG: ATP-binding protein [Opitutaceae bacterium]